MVQGRYFKVSKSLDDQRLVLKSSLVQISVFDCQMWLIVLLLTRKHPGLKATYINRMCKVVNMNHASWWFFFYICMLYCFLIFLKLQLHIQYRKQKAKFLCEKDFYHKTWRGGGGGFKYAKGVMVNFLSLLRVLSYHSVF